MEQFKRNPVSFSEIKIFIIVAWFEIRRILFISKTYYLSLERKLSLKPRGVEQLVIAAYVFQPHVAGDGVHGIVPPHVFNEDQYFRSPAQGAAMHGAGGFIDIVVLCEVF